MTTESDEQAAAAQDEQDRSDRDTAWRQALENELVYLRRAKGSAQEPKGVARRISEVEAALGARKRPQTRPKTRGGS